MKDDQLSKIKIKKYLNPPYKESYNLIVLENVSSTNSYGKKIAQTDSIDKTIVVANTQTGGRGRGENIWESPEHVGIYFTTILRLEIEKTKIPLLNFCFGIAVVETIQKVTGLSVFLKWPNDIYINKKKLGGILIECIGTDKLLLVGGIGLNLNNDHGKFPEKIKNKCTSVYIETGRKYDRNIFIARLVESIENWVIKLCDNNINFIINKWKDLSIDLGTFVSAKRGSEVIYGRAVDVDSNGFLILELENGRLEKVLTL